MSGETRRQQIVEYISNSSKPVPGSDLAREFQVSRQVIVQDIALLRMAHQEIVATNRGYMLNKQQEACRIFKVSHDDSEIVDELYTMVDLGGRVIDVFVKHKVYGQISAPMDIRSRRDVTVFMEEIRSGKSSPLKNITSGYHYHTVGAESTKILDLVEKALKDKNYLVEY